ncbi:hypothetical protein B0T17DRAFT_508801 [Bombardia bombarda]|uniref:DUF7907 domain-containing protein n=1 Tax=Bombardia bombarda TaxID=252184 RepID=A0AA39WTT5_9PEZI|nr:hypothetical protein B0T17DRAFT_508801 [Bombardia bombarda]
MKSTIFSGVLATLLASSAAVLAQDYNQTDPFFLKVTSPTNADVDGTFLYSCHAGAAIQTLCLGTKDTPTSLVSAGFFYNYTVYDGQAASSGLLVWNLPYTSGETGEPATVSLPLNLNYNPGSNVASTLLQPGYDSVSVAFAGSNLVIPSYIDDSTFVAGQRPNITGATTPLTQWYACWVYVGSYYYNALAWVTNGAPHNPTCQAVSVVRVDA